MPARIVQPNSIINVQIAQIKEFYFLENVSVRMDTMIQDNFRKLVYVIKIKNI
jgi:hypothetical protein